MVRRRANFSYNRIIPEQTKYNIDIAVSPRFEEYLFDWDYRTYVVVGAYGSGKSYNTGLKLILKCLKEKRKVLVVREVYDTIRDSCFDLLCEILEGMGILCYDKPGKKNHRGEVYAVTSPMQLRFSNGSKIIFKGMDKPGKLKSINGITDVWLEEASEIKYAGYKELIGRLRTDDVHFFLTFNPVGKDNWVYKHFFKRMDEKTGEMVVKLDDEKLYKWHTMVVGDTYYHHSLPTDNYFLPRAYIKQLDELAEYDEDMYRVARLGRFGTNGLKVLPQFQVAESDQEVMDIVAKTSSMYKFNGFDFGFEESYNALVRMAVDINTMTLYIYDEYYRNHLTDDETVMDLKKRHWENLVVTADSEDPKAIAYYRKRGFKFRKCHKFAGSRLSNTKKVKRFKHIVCSPHCVNTIRELKNLTYKVKPNGDIIYDEFNIDPHTFSAIWYALDKFDVVPIKERKFNTRKAA